MRKLVNSLQEFSIPLIAGVIFAMFWANFGPESYHNLVHTPIYGLGTIFSHHASGDAHANIGWGHYFTLHFLVNDIFMALFFGIAAKEITEACLPNGALNPVKKAINPLFGTVGGVLGPIGVFLLLNTVFGKAEWQKGWGIPTATDIALAWLVIKLLFGARHPAVSFLLLLAVADDAIGLGIIAVGYPDPAHPTEWFNLVWCVPAIAIAWGLRRAKVHSWIPYIVCGGALSWWGLYSAHLHPALALVFIVPFLPGPKKDLGLFVDDEFEKHDHKHSTLENFEHSLKLPVDCGLFFFALVNAGVSFGEVNGLSWMVLSALVGGKMLGVTLFSSAAHAMGFSLPAGMTHRHLIASSAVAGLGLTVALFVSGQAFTDPALQAAAKMGAVFSVVSALVAWLCKVVLRIRPEAAALAVVDSNEPEAELLAEVLEVDAAVRSMISSGNGQSQDAVADQSHSR